MPEGLLSARSALVFNTSDTIPKREMEAFGDPLETIWKNCIFGLCGVAEFHRATYSPIVTSTPEERRLWLCDVAERVRHIFSTEAK